MYMSEMRSNPQRILKYSTAPDDEYPQHYFLQPLSSCKLRGHRKSFDRDASNRSGDCAGTWIGSKRAFLRLVRDIVDMKDPRFPSRGDR